MRSYKSKPSYLLHHSLYLSQHGPWTLKERPPWAAQNLSPFVLILFPYHDPVQLQKQSHSTEHKEVKQKAGKHKRSVDCCRSGICFLFGKGGIKKKNNEKPNLQQGNTSKWKFVWNRNWGEVGSSVTSSKIYSETPVWEISILAQL